MVRGRDPSMDSVSGVLTWHPPLLQDRRRLSREAGAREEPVPRGGLPSPGGPSRGRKARRPFGAVWVALLFDPKCPRCPAGATEGSPVKGSGPRNIGSFLFAQSDPSSPKGWALGGGAKAAEAAAPPVELSKRKKRRPIHMDASGEGRRVTWSSGLRAAGAERRLSILIPQQPQQPPRRQRSPKRTRRQPGSRHPSTGRKMPRPRIPSRARWTRGRSGRL